MTGAIAAGWEIKLGYNPTFGDLHVTPSCPHGGGRGAFTWQIPLANLLREVPPEMLRALLVDAAKPVPAETDVEALCRRAVANLGDLTGKTVLDIGGYDGRFAKQALDQGAAEALCLDNQQWEHYGWKSPARFADVEYRWGDFTNWVPTYDVVICFNVIYHVKAPQLALEALRSITRERLLLCSLVVWDDRPVWVPRAPFEVNAQDDTVYWSPSDAGLRKSLEIAGFTVQEVGKAVERLILDCH